MARARTLIGAAECGDLELVKTMLDSGEEVNQSNARGHNALKGAVRGNHVEVVKLLLAEGARVNDTTAYAGESALTIAIKYADIEMVKLILDAGGDVLLGTNCHAIRDATSPLHAAVGAGNLDAVALLLSFDADLGSRDSDGESVFDIAVRANDAAMLKHLLNIAIQINVAVNAQRLFIHAVDTDNGEAFRCLLNSGLKFNANKLSYHQTARILSWFPDLVSEDDLTNLAMSGLPVWDFITEGENSLMRSTDTQKLLTALAASEVVEGKVSKKDLRAFLDSACEGLEPECWAWLFKAAKKRDPQLLSFVASKSVQRWEAPEIVDVLLDAGVSFTELDDAGLALIHRMVGLPAQFFKRLAQHRVDINTRDALGWTPLHHAAELQEEQAITALVNAGADPTVADGKGNTPASLAENRRIRLLLQKATESFRPESRPSRP